MPININTDETYGRFGSEAGSLALLEMSASDLLGLFRELPFTSIVTVDHDATLTEIDESTARRLGIDRGCVVGRRIDETVEHAPARERLQFIRKVFGAPVQWHLAVDMYWGHQVWHFARVIEGDASGGTALFLMLTPPATDPFPDSIDRTLYEYVSDAGPLSVLTSAEAEVLRMLALSYTQEKIAHELHRSVKAIERRRTTLGRKLNAQNRSELALIGAMAGLHRFSHDELLRIAERSFGAHAHSPAEQTMRD